MTSTSLDDAARPRYLEIGEWLTAECDRLPVGTLLPSEPQLAERFGVSRMTARHAPESLREAGRIERRRGVGSFVAGPQLHRRDAALRSLSEEVAVRGMSAGSIVLEASMVVRPAEAAALGLDPKRPLVYVDRVRLADGVPMARERVHMPERYRAAAESAVAAGADYIKTSTGFYTGKLQHGERSGAFDEMVDLMQDAAAGRCKVKGSGAIRDRAHFLRLIDKGIDRMGVGYRSVPTVLGLD